MTAAPAAPLDLPSWLLPTNTAAPESKAMRHLDPENHRHFNAPAEVVRAQYPTLFEVVLDDVASGKTIREALEGDPRSINIGDFLKWVMIDPKRKERYREAQAIATEVHAADIVDISDGEHSLEDVARSTLRVNTRLKLMAFHNRERYGDIKQIDVHSQNETTFTFALTRPHQDERVIDVTPDPAPVAHE